MTTKKFFAVEVFDNTCNGINHESGIYGRGDYSWVDQPLNGGDGDYNMTEDEALAQKADFERIIKERNLEWASVDIDSIDVPVAETMQDIADYYNESDCIDVPELERMIEANGWVSDCGEEWGVCHNSTEKVVLNDEGEAIVVSVDNSNTITLYLINQYEAYIAAEQGIIAVRNMPIDTIDYKHELLEQAEVELPNGFSIEKTQGEGEEIFKGNEGAELVTEFTGGKYVTSLVTSDGIQTLKVWNYGRD